MVKNNRRSYWYDVVGIDASSLLGIIVGSTADDCDKVRLLKTFRSILFVVVSVFFVWSAVVTDRSEETIQWHRKYGFVSIVDRYNNSNNRNILLVVVVAVVVGVVIIRNPWYVVLVLPQRR